MILLSFGGMTWQVIVQRHKRTTTTGAHLDPVQGVPRPHPLPNFTSLLSDWG